MRAPKIFRRLLRTKTTNNNAMLVSTARSGTNYFLDVYSNVVADSVAYREIFRSEGDSFDLLEKRLGLKRDAYFDMLKSDPLQVWLNVEAGAARAGQRAVAKIFYGHANEHQDLWNYFRDNNCVVHLIRRNPFNSLISLHVANQTGKWLQPRGRQGAPTPEPFELPRELAEEYLKKSESDVENTRKFFQGSDYHEVFYEDIGRSPRACAEAIARILGDGLITGEPKTGLLKQKKYTNAEIILNYNDVRDLDRDLH